MLALAASLSLAACDEAVRTPLAPETTTPAATVPSFYASSNESALVRNPANGHYYQAVSHVPDGITYDKAKKDAALRVAGSCRSAHLVTITSRAENDFLVQNFSQAIASPPEYYTAKNRQSYYRYFGFWIGAELVEDAAAPDGFRWSWVTGEPFDFFNWFAVGVPNGFPRENRIHFWVNPTGVADWKVGGWNDAPPYFEFPGYIVEYENCDETAPVIAVAVEGKVKEKAVSQDWLASDVAVAWSVTEDPGHNVDATIGCDPKLVTFDTPGLPLTCTATSKGGTASRTITVKRDATPPTLTLARNQGRYTVDQTVSIACTAADAVSGVARACTGLDRPAYTFALGPNLAAFDAMDAAGNEAVASASFAVSVSYPSLCALGRQFVARALQAEAFCHKLNEAATARDPREVKRHLTGYIDTVKDQIDKTVTRAHADVLVSLAQTFLPK